MIRKIYEIALFPLSLIYGAAVWIRNFLFDRGILPSGEFRVPVISIGNLSVGGTGKTPHTEYIINLLLPYFRIAVLSRGYKRRTKGFILADSRDNAETIGDEPAQIMKKFSGITVAVDASRVNGINEIIKRAPETEVIILDDAFQHRWVTPGLSILITPFNRLYTRDRLLPAGRLREPASGSRRADIILISSTPATTTPMDKRIIVRELSLLSHQNLWFTSVKYGSLYNIHTCDESLLSLDDIRDMQSEILLVTGIANPDAILEYLKNFSPDVTHISFRDHHSYSESDIIRIREALSKLNPANRCIITTEKDSVRLRLIAGLRNHFDDNFYYLPITISLQEGEKKEFDNYIREYVEKNRTNRKIS
ncbi:MAG: tetraacyldisaccharide 4'-kinase [Bacteroidales bacterium]|nr:tetraacyldisaccharide 4'-kinase [Bacteroidales bacterium]